MDKKIPYRPDDWKKTNIMGTSIVNLTDYDRVLVEAGADAMLKRLIGIAKILSDAFIDTHSHIAPQYRFEGKMGRIVFIPEEG